MDWPKPRLLPNVFKSFCAAAPVSVYECSRSPEAPLNKTGVAFKWQANSTSSYKLAYEFKFYEYNIKQNKQYDDNGLNI